MLIDSPENNCSSRKFLNLVLMKEKSFCQGAEHAVVGKPVGETVCDDLCCEWYEERKMFWGRDFYVKKFPRSNKNCIGATNRTSGIVLSAFGK